MLLQSKNFSYCFIIHLYLQKRKPSSFFQIGRDEDTFLVRNNFDHLESFLSYSLIIHIPKSEETILLTLKMNVANFVPGQVEPAELLSNAIGDRFSVVDRILNLENFSSSAGLFWFFF